VIRNGMRDGVAGTLACPERSQARGVEARPMPWKKPAGLLILALSGPLAGAPFPARSSSVLASSSDPAGAGIGALPVKSEHLFYQATWNGLPVAGAELTIASDKRQRGRSGNAISLRGRAETYQPLDLLWRMRDSFEATVDADPPAPSRFLLRQHENSRRRETSIVRDGTRARLVGEKRRRGRVPRVAEIGLHRGLHDPASLGYLIRSLPQELDRPQTYEVFTGTKVYTVTVTPVGTDTVDALGRTWKARKLRLALRLAGASEGRTTSGGEAGSTAPGAEASRSESRGEADLWISSDRDRLPLRLQAFTSWGWIAVQLVGRGALPVGKAAA
jgi:hypothetical protein